MLNFGDLTGMRTLGNLYFNKEYSINLKKKKKKKRFRDPLVKQPLEIIKNFSAALKRIRRKLKSPYFILIFS